ncbi:hypothetical protein HDU79_003350 [Rhizoclosmatium sp. JEL0117]|nr:hypothetical protein HDU79_003350 [Rhizoclosmatium sp. JEL0117]
MRAIVLQCTIRQQTIHTIYSACILSFSTSGILLLNCINSNCGRKSNTNWISDLSAMTPILQQTAMTCSAIRNEDLNSTADSFYFVFNQDSAAIMVADGNGNLMSIPNPNINTGPNSLVGWRFSGAKRVGGSRGRECLCQKVSD